MCTYNLTFDDTVVGNAKAAFPTHAAITEWMQVQIERMLKQIAVEPDANKVPLRKLNVSDRIKSLSAVPASYSHADYKDEMELLFSDKY